MIAVDEALIGEVMAAGIDGFIGKNIAPDEILHFAGCCDERKHGCWCVCKEFCICENLFVCHMYLTVLPFLHGSK